MRGARLDLEGASGIGRLDLVRKFVDGSGRLLAGAMESQLRSGFNRACEYGHPESLNFSCDCPPASET